MATTSSTPIAQFQGFATGLDTASIISALSQVKRAPIDRLDATKAKLQKQQTQFTTLKAKVDALTAKLKELDTSAEFSAFTTTSTDTAAIAATANGSANEGTYQIAVSRLAAAESHSSQGFASKTTLLGHGAIGFTVDDVDFTVNISSDATLEQVRDAINNSTAPVTATIINDGTATSPYKLVVTSEKTGAKNAFTVDFNNFTAASSAPSVLNLSNQLKAGTDASFTINSVQVSSPTNVVDQTIDGVTFTLTKENSTATVTVARDNAAVKTKVKSVITAFNDVINELKSQEDPALKDTKAVLYGDSTITALDRQIQNLIRTQVTGSSSSFRTLASIGVETTSNGKIQLDETAFDRAIAADPDGIARIFTDATTGIAQKVKTSGEAINKTINSRTSTIRDRIRQGDQRAADLQVQLDRYIDGLRTKFGNLEQVVGQLQSQGASLSGILG